MILFRPTKFFFFIAWLAVAAARARDVGLQKAIDSLIAAEKVYAKLAGEKGFREASMSVFADDAVIFAPNAVNGKKILAQSQGEPCHNMATGFLPPSRGVVSSVIRLGHGNTGSRGTRRSPMGPAISSRFGERMQTRRAPDKAPIASPLRRGEGGEELIVAIAMC
jgi:hypothetical protein